MKPTQAAELLSLFDKTSAHAKREEKKRKPSDFVLSKLDKANVHNTWARFVQFGQTFRQGLSNNDKPKAERHRYVR